MTVTPVPFEPTRFWVSSENPKKEPYLVDFDWRDEKWHRPKAVCGCPDCFAKGFRPCKHIWAVVDSLKLYEASNPYQEMEEAIKAVRCSLPRSVGKRRQADKSKV